LYNSASHSLQQTITVTFSGSKEDLGFYWEDIISGTERQNAL